LNEAVAATGAPDQSDLSAAFGSGVPKFQFEANICKKKAADFSAAFSESSNA
jgi:hypothetical protein